MNKLLEPPARKKNPALGVPNDGIENCQIFSTCRIRAFNSLADGGQICDLAYEMFDCVSDKIDQVSIFEDFRFSDAERINSY